MESPSPRAIAATGDDELTLADLEAVAAVLPDLEAVAARPAEWGGGAPAEDGVMQMPYAVYAPEVMHVLSELDRRHLLRPFDWAAWQPEARRYVEDAAAVATAPLDDVRRLLTLHVRKERFCEGHLEEMIKSGHVSALLRRLVAIAGELRARAGHPRLRLVRGDITRLAVDAIVNAANSALMGGGGVDGAIHRAAGPELPAACRALGGCPTGEARLTPGFRLPARWIIHAVGPVWRGGDHDEEQLLASAYRASIELAAANDCRTIAFPAISCGAYRFPLARAAAIAVTTTRAACELHPGLDEVSFVAFEDDVAAALSRALGTS